jgi:DNA-binding XRE family transcriptional regulator
MDPERNHGGKPSPSGDDSAVSADAVPPSAEPRGAGARSSEPNEGGEPDDESEAGSGGKRSRRTRTKAGSHPNNVRKLRQSAMMSKAELARRAGVSPLTIDRVEAGHPCRMDTKRKILEALGLQPSGARDVFPDLDLP